MISNWDRLNVCARSKLRHSVRYRRFSTAAQAIRVVVEDVPAIRALGAWMQVGDSRFDSEEIRRLYESDDYPLRRRTQNPSNWPTSSSLLLSSRLNGLSGHGEFEPAQECSRGVTTDPSLWKGEHRHHVPHDVWSCKRVAEMDSPRDSRGLAVALPASRQPGPVSSKSKTRFPAR